MHDDSPQQQIDGKQFFQVARCVLGGSSLRASRGRGSRVWVGLSGVHLSQLIAILPLLLPAPRLPSRPPPARSKLSYEQFSQFLHNIKELNAGRQKREDTLRRVHDIFGYQHQDLYGGREEGKN